MPPVILGKKVGMTQAYTAEGKMIPVTVIEVGPCVVLQVKTREPVAGKSRSEGYDAIQIGYDEAPLRSATLPQQGHALKAGTTPRRFVQELKFHPARDGKPDVAAGATLTVDQFANIGYVDIVGITKGKGFQGVMKRHNFGGQPASHGTERKHRSPGSIGGMAPGAPGRGIKKGKRMSGHMGFVRRTTRNHEVISTDPANNLIVVQGSIPGPKGGYLFVRESKTRRGPKPPPRVQPTKAKGKTIVKKK